MNTAELFYFNKYTHIISKLFELADDVQNTREIFQALTCASLAFQ